MCNPAENGLSVSAIKASSLQAWSTANVIAPIHVTAHSKNNLPINFTNGLYRSPCSDATGRVVRGASASTYEGHEAASKVDN